MNGVRPTSASGALGLPGVGLLSRSPFLPIPLEVGGWGMVGVGGRGQAGVSGGPPPGQLSPALGWLERTAGKVALGSPPSWRRVHHRQVLQLPSPSPPPPPPPQQRLPNLNLGPREPDLSLCSLPSRHSPLRVTPCFLGGRPSKGATAFPPRPQGGLSPVRPGEVVPSSRRVVFWSRRSGKRAHGVSGDVSHPPDLSRNKDKGV